MKHELTYSLARPTCRPAVPNPGYFLCFQEAIFPAVSSYYTAWWHPFRLVAGRFNCRVMGRLTCDRRVTVWQSFTSLESLPTLSNVKCVKWSRVT